MIISKTPLRASLFGGGSDFKSYYSNSIYGYGSVISMAINSYVYITINKRFDDKIKIVYNENELVDSVAEIKHNIIREALKLTKVTKGIEIIYMGDLPFKNVGIGLASSSALTVGVLNALHAYKKEYVSKETLAKEACHIEIECLGQKIGIQDQYAVANGGFNKYRFYKNGDVSVTPIIIDEDKLNELMKNIIIYFTGNTRDSRKILDEQVKNIEHNKNNIDELVKTVDFVYEKLVCGDIDIVGKELDKTWNIKKLLSTDISNSHIDKMYDIAKNNGALGGKILGAGGGGFMLIYAPLINQKKIREGMKEYRELKFDIDYNGSRIIYSN